MDPYKIIIMIIMNSNITTNNTNYSLNQIILILIVVM